MARKKNNKNRLKEHIHGWAASCKIGKVITSNFNLEEVLSVIASIASAATESVAASVITVSVGTKGVCAPAGFGINKDVLLKGPFEFEKRVIHHLNHTKKIFAIDDITKKAKFRYPAFLADGEFLSSFCVPVIFNRKLLAALILYSGKRANYTKMYLKTSSALAYQIALAIQNYHLYNNMHVNYFNTIRSLVLAMEAKDPYTKGHSERVTEYSLIIANNMSLDPHQVQMIKYCGLLHDLGKIAITDTILNKPDSLNDEEIKNIQRHPAEGASVLSPLSFLRPGIPIVRHHHERFDGSGYPDRLKAEKIPLTARILACADAYDAMTSDRPYRNRIPKEEAFLELKNNSGTQFDPQVVDVFIKSMIGEQENT